MRIEATLTSPTSVAEIALHGRACGWLHSWSS